LTEEFSPFIYDEQPYPKDATFKVGDMFGDFPNKRIVIGLSSSKTVDGRSMGRICSTVGPANCKACVENGQAKINRCRVAPKAS